MPCIGDAATLLSHHPLAAHAFANGWQLKSKLLNRTQDKFWKDAFPAPGAGAGVDPDSGLIARYNRRKNDTDTERNACDLYLTGPFSALGRNHHATLGYNRDHARAASMRRRSLGCR